MINFFKRLFKSKSPNPNQDARNEQRVIFAIFLIAFMSVGAIYLYKKNQPKKKIVEAIHFDGTFDKKFTQGSDESLLIKHQHQLKALEERLGHTENKLLEKQTIKPAIDEESKQRIDALAEKLSKLESENQLLKNKVQLASNQPALPSLEMPVMPMDNQVIEQRASSYAEQVGIETITLNSDNKKEEHRPDNYVWAGTFVSGILLTGVMGDAGVNGTKNTGTVLIRLDENGTMPNGTGSRLKDCFVLGSSYGDLSGDSVVIHTETLSCAKKGLSFELKVYGSVYDQDAMQDVRGTPLLKTKPLLGYSAAAGFLAGIGKGIENFGSIQAGPTETLMALNASKIVGRSAAGGAVSHPAHRVPEYIMKIADLYHPLVVARAGRRVSVLFIKGFWIDSAHQKFESGKAIDDGKQGMTRTITQVSNLSQKPPFENQALFSTPESSS